MTVLKVRDAFRGGCGNDFLLSVVLRFNIILLGHEWKRRSLYKTLSFFNSSAGSSVRSSRRLRNDSTVTAHENRATAKCVCVCVKIYIKNQTTFSNHLLLNFFTLKQGIS